MTRLVNSILAAAALAALAGCTSEDSVAPPAPSPPVTETPVTPPTAERRTLVDKSAFATSPVNLLLDPNFALSSDQASRGTFLAFYEGDYSLLTLTTSTESRSPAGFSGSIGHIKPAGATNTKSKSVLLLTSFQGGEGPFDAQVWVSKSDVSGAPVDVAIDDDGITASITDSSPNGEAFDLKPVEGANRVAAGRTWVLLRGQVPRALPHGGFFLVHTGTGGGQYLVAAPELVAQPLVTAMATRSLTLSAKVTARATKVSEREAIARYTAIPPRLTPATINTRRGL